MAKWLFPRELKEIYRINPETKQLHTCTQKNQHSKKFFISFLLEPTLNLDTHQTLPLNFIVFSLKFILPHPTITGKGSVLHTYTMENLLTYGPQSPA